MSIMENIIIISSETGELNINFDKALKVENRRIALLSITHSSTRRRARRVAKDGTLGDTALIYCDVVKEKTFVNNTQQRCLDFVVLNEFANSVEIQNPIYHELRVNDLMSINIQIRSLNGELFQFSDFVVVKLALK